MVAAGINPTRFLVSQFPLWDFFECNTSRAYSMGSMNSSLNSLCGISSNATGTLVRSVRLDDYVNSQFPLWDFFECNPVSWTASGLLPGSSSLSIPFVGFLRMQQCSRSRSNGEGFITVLSIPFVGFLRMQRNKVVQINMVGNTRNSQFPLWDFFECNMSQVPDEEPSEVDLSIPFVGFLRMQPPLCYHGNANRYNYKLSIPFVGFLRMQQYDYFRQAYFTLLQIQLSIPFVGFLRMQLFIHEKQRIK